MTRRRRIGDRGERIAEGYLTERGFEILERNWRGERGELDLVAMDGGVLVMVEVKTRRGAAMGAAEEAVGPAKADRLLRLGAEYVAAHPEHADALWRVDLVAITLSRAGQVERLTHLVNACSSG